MPHKVADFFRQSTTSLENQVLNLKKTAANATRRRDSPQRQGLARNSRSSERVFSYASSIDEDTEEPQRLSRPRMTTESRQNSSSSDREPKEHHHRLSFPHFGRGSKENHSHHANAPASLDWKLESPPIVLYGNAEESSGALVSGQLLLNIKEGMDIDSFNACLNIHVTQKRPFTQHCYDCTNQFTELKKWDFLKQPLFLAKGQHAFPFSILLEGHLPASMDGALVSIAYEFTAEAVSRSTGFSTKLQKLLDVKRSIPVPETPHHSVRVFPPTNIKASVHYPHVIHPIGTNKLELRLDGLAKHNAGPNTVEYWKLKKLIWRLEETAKSVAPACEKHMPKLPAGEEERPASKKGVQRTDTRTIGEKVMFSGWKSNYATTAESMVELEFDYSLLKHAKYSCATKSRDGTEVSHQLMVEMVVSQEWAPVNKPTFITQTGVGRILRMHFATTLTECGGIGISWDNEAPPIYQDVPPSPPGY
ncbi:hypothetical protein GQ53DRAFT_596023, partial [Thozetella sp. PMI_491]